jgi:hypothetical protein
MSASSSVERENLRCGVFIPPWSLPLTLSPTAGSRAARPAVHAGPSAPGGRERDDTVRRSNRGPPRSGDAVLRSDQRPQTRDPELQLAHRRGTGHRTPSGHGPQRAAARRTLPHRADPGSGPERSAGRTRAVVHAHERRIRRPAPPAPGSTTSRRSTTDRAPSEPWTMPSRPWTDTG